MDCLKSSFYNIFFENNGKCYVYNTLTVAIAELDRDTFLTLKENRISGINEEYIYEMIEQGFLVDENENEQAKYLYFYNKMRLGSVAKLLSITFVPSYACNLACPYCLQGAYKNEKALNDKQTDTVLKFAEKMIIFSHQNGQIPISHIHANLYGGEPMMQKQAIMRYCDGMNSLAKKYNCEIHYMMTSNFTLLDDDILDMIERYKIQTQISIDGNRKEHDKRRIFKNGSGTYDLIIGNLQKMQKRHLADCVVIRLNIDQNNIQCAEEVLEAVHEYSTDVYFGFLESFNGYNDDFSPNVVSNEGNIKAGEIKKLNDLLRKYNFTVPEEFGKISPCAINCVNKFFVDCDLNVYTCELALKHPELRVGVLAEDGEFIPNNNFYVMMNRSPANYPECMRCKFMPICAGGCAAKAYIRDNKQDGNLDRRYCMLDEEALISYLKDYVIRLET